MRKPRTVYSVQLRVGNAFRKNCPSAEILQWGHSRKSPTKMSTGPNSKVTSEVGLVTKEVSWRVNASAQVHTTRCGLGCPKGRENTERQRCEVWGLNAREVT